MLISEGSYKGHYVLSPEEYREYEEYLECKNRDLNKELRRYIRSKDYSSIRKIICNKKLQNIEYETYSLLFEREEGAADSKPKFIYILEDSLKDHELNYIVRFFLKDAPFYCLYQDEPEYAETSSFLINYVFKFHPDLIPKMLDSISSVKHCVIIFGKELFSKMDCNSDHYFNTQKAIKKYCVQNKSGYYEIVPNYLFHIEDQLPKLKQNLTNIAIAIDDSNFSELKNYLRELKANVPCGENDITNQVSDSLDCLIKRAAQLKDTGVNQKMIYAISDARSNVTTGYSIAFAGGIKRRAEEESSETASSIVENLTLLSTSFGKRKK